MKKYILMATMLTMFAIPAMAQTALPPGGNGNGPAPQGQIGEKEDAQHFQAHKAELLQHMNDHLVDVQKRIACVQAANDHQAMRACMPQRGEGPGGMRRGPGGQPGGTGGEGPGPDNGPGGQK